MPKKNDKLKNFADVAAFVKKEKRAGKRIVTTNGCFDIVHVGHVRSLEAAKALGDVLIVGINSDASVRALKGKERPIIPERERAEVIAALRAVDAAFIFKTKTPKPWLSVLQPHIHVKGGDRRLDQIIEKDVVEAGGGKITLFPVQKGRSTTKIIEKIRRSKN